MYLLFFRARIFSLVDICMCCIIYLLSCMLLPAGLLYRAAVQENCWGDILVHKCLVTVMLSKALCGRSLAFFPALIPPPKKKKTTSIFKKIYIKKNSIYYYICLVLL